MPGGDGTGPWWGGSGWGRGSGGRWCVGADVGWGGHGRRNMYRATGLPGWMRWGRPGEVPPLPEYGAENERHALESQAHVLESELRRIRSRLGELEGKRPSKS
jgi:hypothetical protein